LQKKYIGSLYKIFVCLSVLQMFEQTILQYSQILNNFSHEGIYTIESHHGQLLTSEFKKI